MHHHDDIIVDSKIFSDGFVKKNFGCLGRNQSVAVNAQLEPTDSQGRSQRDEGRDGQRTPGTTDGAPRKRTEELCDQIACY
jgi:hypothetical protein